MGADVMTIGISLEIPQPFGDELRDARRQIGDPQADSIPPHITLIAPLDIEAGELPAINDHLRSCAQAWAPFPIRLRGTGTFRPISDVVFIQVAHGIASCEQLQVMVNSGPIQAVSKFNYHPHVTIAHNLADADLDRAFEQFANYDVDFMVGHLTLYRHGEDGVWRPVHHYPFTQH